MFRSTNDVLVKAQNKMSQWKENSWNTWNKKTKIIAAACAVAVLFFGSVVAIQINSAVYSLSIHGTVVGYIDNEKEVAETALQIQEDFQEAAGDLVIRFQTEEVVCQPVDQMPEDVALLTDQELKQLLRGGNLFLAEAWSIRINGKEVVTTATQEESDQIIAGVKSAYQTPGSELVNAEFKEAVVVTKAAVQVASILKPEEAISLIVTGEKEPKVHTVQGGDTIWDIAIDNDMSTSELIAANPGFDPEAIKIGQKLNLFIIKPYVTVVMTEKLTATESIPFDTIYENTDSLYKGDTKVKTAGVEGSKETISIQVKENGTLISSTVSGTKVISEPLSQQSFRGTKSLASFVGTGSFVRPVSGSISSGFGSRGGSRHTGIDIPQPYGTPIAAADDGVVVFAGRDGAYGNLIRLSHGNGFETWYAHCSSISVSIGQVVDKGETIGKVGSTGRSTGNHLHFEVRKNGVPQNPVNYL